MAIIETVGRDIPWKHYNDAEVVGKLLAGAQHPKGFTNKQWYLVQALCDYSPETRITMQDVTKKLHEVTEVEQVSERETQSDVMRNAFEPPSSSVELDDAPFELEVVATTEATVRVGAEAVEALAPEEDEAEPESEHIESPSAAVELLEIPSWLKADSDFEAFFSVIASRLEVIENALRFADQSARSRQLHGALIKHNEIIQRVQVFEGSVMQSANEIIKEAEVMRLSFAVNTQIDELITSSKLQTHGDWTSNWTARSDQRAIEYGTRLGQLCLEMRENESVARFLVARLTASLRKLLTPISSQPQGEKSVAAAAVFDRASTELLKFMEKSVLRMRIFHRIASSHVVVAELHRLHQGVADLARMLSATDKELVDWEQEWRELFVIRASSLEVQLKQLGSISELLPDRRSQEEALVLLKFELERNASASSEDIDPFKKLVEEAFEKTNAKLNLDVQSAPGWFIPSYELRYNNRSLGQGSFAVAHLGG